MKKTSSVLAELRSDVIFRHIQRLVRDTIVSVEDYSEDVLRVWLERTSPGARAADFREAGPVYDRMSGNGQKIRRWMNAEFKARPTVDVEEALVLALPEPYRTDCRRELARRYGLLDIVDPDLPINSCASDMQAMGEVATEFGELMTSVAGMLADGKFDASDAPQIPHALDECEKMIARVMVIRMHLQRALPAGSD